MILHDYISSDVYQRRHAILIGHPVSHSLSPLMHNTSADYYDLDLEYVAVDIDSHQLGTAAFLLNNKNLVGVNITLPHKRQIMKIVDRLTPEAQSIGAVNTIYKESHTLIGHNTDSYGFSKPLLDSDVDLDGHRVIIFGTGGATKAILHALSNMGVAEVVMVSRNPDRNQHSDANTNGSSTESMYVTVTDYYAWSAYANEASLIVNATPLGMSPNIDNSPVADSETDLLADKICYDIVYNPMHTKFLRQAESSGAETIHGIDMLIHQGSKSFKKWTGKTFPVDKIRHKLLEYFK